MGWQPRPRPRGPGHWSNTNSQKMTQIILKWQNWPRTNKAFRCQYSKHIMIKDPVLNKWCINEQIKNWLFHSWKKPLFFLSAGSVRLIVSMWKGKNNKNHSIPSTESHAHPASKNSCRYLSRARAADNRFLPNGNKITLVSLFSDHPAQTRPIQTSFKPNKEWAWVISSSVLNITCFEAAQRLFSRALWMFRNIFWMCGEHFMWAGRIELSGQLSG